MKFVNCEHCGGIMDVDRFLRCPSCGAPVTNINLVNGNYPKGFVTPRFPHPDAVNQQRVIQPNYDPNALNRYGINQPVNYQPRFNQSAQNPNGYTPNKQGYYPQRETSFTMDSNGRLHRGNANVKKIEEEIERKRKLRNRVISLSLAGSILLTGFVMFLNKDNSKGKETVVVPVGIHNNYNNGIHDGYPTYAPTAIPTAIPTAAPTVEPVSFPVEMPVAQVTSVPTQAPTYGLDTVIANKDVNMRLSADKNSFQLGTFSQGSYADRIFTDGTWDLIRVGDTLAYVYSSYTRVNDVDYFNEYYDVEEYHDVAYTLQALNFRTGPSTNEKKLFTLKENEQLIVLGKAYIRHDPSEVWYIVKARGQIGFVLASKTRSIRGDLQRFDPNIEDVEIRKICRITDDTSLTDAAGNRICYISKYQTVNVIESFSNYSIVDYEGTVGIISNKNIKAIDNYLLIVDKSSQRVFWCENGEVAFYGTCTTGKNGSETDECYKKTYGKSKGHDFGHDGYVAQELWMPFNGGQGLHDAPWQKESKFGDPDYRKRHGSAGCVRLPRNVAVFIYKHMPKGTYVLVKK